MRFLRLATMVLAIMGGYLGFANGSASATPLGAGSLATGAAQSENSLATYVQYGGGYGRRYYRPGRRIYRPYRGYRPYRRAFRPYRGFRPRVVCRVRITPFGPRRVCVRR